MITGSDYLSLNESDFCLVVFFFFINSVLSSSGADMLRMSRLLVQIYQVVSVLQSFLQLQSGV